MGCGYLVVEFSVQEGRAPRIPGVMVVVFWMTLFVVAVPEGEEPDEDTEALLAADFEIGHFIRERIVPRAVLYFTGEALEDDDVRAHF